ncbi:MAG: polysaccharide biosynthesis/export family protein [Ferruginibacter sp.]
MYKKYINFSLLVSIVIYSASCVNTRKSTYFNDAQTASIKPNAQDSVSPLIQKNDIISVIITSLNAEASAIFNLSNITSSSTVTNVGSSQSASGYLVNSDGFIQLPILGRIEVAGSTTKQIKDQITAILLDKKLLIDPIVTVHHLNYEVTVLGEVGKPTVINVPSEKISLLKALGLAGDITIFGKKDNVLLIREIGGKRIVRRIDLNNPEFLASPFYYLQPNDVVYVEANKNKVASSSATKQTIPILLSGLSILLLALDRIIK